MIKLFKKIDTAEILIIIYAGIAIWSMLKLRSPTNEGILEVLSSALKKSGLLQVLNHYHQSLQQLF
jgi:hypothetical protein